MIGYKGFLVNLLALIAYICFLACYTDKGFDPLYKLSENINGCYKCMMGKILLKIYVICTVLELVNLILFLYSDILELEGI